MNRKGNRNQDTHNAAKLNTPPRETSEMSDLNEIERLLETQRQNDEALVQKKESLRARLNLLEEGVAGGRSQEQGVRRQESEGEIERLKKEINDLSAENLALQEARENKSDRNIVAFVVVLVIAIVIAFVCGQSINERKYKQQQQRQEQQHEERQVAPVPTPEPPMPIPLLTMTHTELDLLRSAGKLVNRDIDKYESVGDALSAFYAESPMSVRDAVIEKLGGVRSLDDFPKELEDVLGRIVVIEDSPRPNPLPEGEGTINTPNSSLLTPDSSTPQRGTLLRRR